MYTHKTVLSLLLGLASLMAAGPALSNGLATTPVTAQGGARNGVGRQKCRTGWVERTENEDDRGRRFLH